ncbi:MAG: hypothetical protein K2M12_04800, partial [Muribaculaceae bacterium]|nr:hypothetical protein [Muribaculaceae bacterium]
MSTHAAAQIELPQMSSTHRSLTPAGEQSVRYTRTPSANAGLLGATARVSRPAIIVQAASPVEIRASDSGARSSTRPSSVISAGRDEGVRYMVPRAPVRADTATPTAISSSPACRIAIR